MRSIVATRDRNTPVERAHVPVYEGRDLAAIGHPDRDLLAMILGTFSRVQRPPESAIAESIHLAGDRRASIAHGGRIRAQIEQARGDRAVSETLRPIRDQPVQAKPGHERAVDEDQIARVSGHRATSWAWHLIDEASLQS